MVWSSAFEIVTKRGINNNNHDDNDSNDDDDDDVDNNNNIFNRGKPVSRSCYKYRTIPENKPLQI